MKRRNFLAGMASFLEIKKTYSLAQNPPPADYREVCIVFVSNLDGSVYEVTSELLTLQDSPSYGSDFVEGVGAINLSSLPGWNYLVNDVLPLTPAQSYAVSIGDVIEWRLGRS